MLAWPGFRYDTDPAARAVVAVRRIDPELALAYLHSTQRAFYAEGRDVTDLQVLCDLACEHGLDREAFETVLAGEDLKEETWRDYAVSQRAGVTGFPTLVAGAGDGSPFGVVTRGYNSGEQVLAALHNWVEGSVAGVA